MQLIQRKFATKIQFDFSNDVLNYSIKDSNGSSSYKYKYENIDIKSEGEMSTRNPWFRNVGMILVIIGFAEVYFKYADYNKVIFPFWILLGALLTAVYFINITRYKVFQVENGTLLVIQNNDQDIIIDEIRKRRNKKLKEKYFEIDFRNGIESEIAKYKWLEEENVITKDEYKEKVTELRINYINSSFSVN